MDGSADTQCVCKDCGRTFVFSAAERHEFAAHGRHHAPGRCPECRSARALRHREQGESRAAYVVTCARCGVRTHVPFVPRTEKPIYCRPCYLETRSR